ncbi:MAG: (2Fe-2S)-binding protein [Rhodomicrobium sp.]
MSKALSPVTFRLNGEVCTVYPFPQTRLIDILHDELSLTAAKKGCGIGRCGSCAVLVNGSAANACLLMAWQLESANVITPEGLDAMPVSVAIREALDRENAFQCGYCAPGFTITLTALLSENPSRSEADILAAMEGNICRCTGYHSIIRGTLAAVAAFKKPAVI